MNTESHNHEARSGRTSDTSRKPDMLPTGSSLTTKLHFDYVTSSECKVVAQADLTSLVWRCRARQLLLGSMLQDTALDLQRTPSGTDLQSSIRYVNYVKISIAK
jgi:hypothetical protein